MGGAGLIWGADCAVPGKSGLCVRGEGERVMALQSWVYGSFASSQLLPPSPLRSHLAYPGFSELQRDKWRTHTGWQPESLM